MLCKLAKEPDGSLQSYREQTKDLVFGLQKKLEAFEMKYGDFLVESILKENDVVD